MVGGGALVAELDLAERVASVAADSVVVVALLCGAPHAVAADVDWREVADRLDLAAAIGLVGGVVLDRWLGPRVLELGSLQQRNALARDGRRHTKRDAERRQLSAGGGGAATTAAQLEVGGVDDDVGLWPLVLGQPVVVESDVPCDPTERPRRALHELAPEDFDLSDRLELHEGFAHLCCGGIGRHAGGGGVLKHEGHVARELVEGGRARVQRERLLRKRHIDRWLTLLDDLDVRFGHAHEPSRPHLHQGQRAQILRRGRLLALGMEAHHDADAHAGIRRVRVIVEYACADGHVRDRVQVFERLLDPSVCPFVIRCV